MLDGRDPDFEAGLKRSFLDLTADPAALAAMSSAAARLCDGQGAARVAAAVLSLAR